MTLCMALCMYTCILKFQVKNALPDSPPLDLFSRISFKSVFHDATPKLDFIIAPFFAGFDSLQNSQVGWENL